MNSSKSRQGAIKKLKALLFTPKSEIESFRQKIDQTFSSVYLPNGVELEEKEYGRIKCDVLSPELYASNRVLIYIHGGSFVGGSRRSYRAFASSLANACAAKAVLPEFRLAPSFPFPNGVEDVERVFKSVYTEFKAELSASGDGEEIEKPELIIAADTTGASIALAAVFQSDAEFKSSVKKIVLFSPWLNVSEDDDMFAEKKAQDEVFTSESVRFCAENYTYEENWNNPLVSPLKAPLSMLKELPDVFIQCGENELFYDDNVIFSAKLKNAGTKCELDVWPKMMPAFVLADDFLEESHLAVEKIGRMFTAQKEDDELLD